MSTPDTCDLIIVAAMPPPLHGQSAATAALVSALRSSGVDHRLLDTSPGALVRSWSYHRRRFFRVINAMAAILRYRASPRCQLYTVVESGLGQFYNVALVLAARTKGMTTLLHHHTRRHLERRTRLFALLCRLAGPHGVHIVGSPRMQTDLQRSYGTAQRTVLLHNAWLIEPPAAGGAPPDRSGSTFRLGHLSNLSPEKGLDLVLETAIAVHGQGRDVRLHLAGPIVTSAAGAKIERARAILGDRLEVLGPVSGREKARFFENCDVFLFPSTYKNETHGLVLAEAMSFGVPAITLDTGYISEFVDGCGIVVRRPEEFVEQSVAQIERWIDLPESLPPLAEKCRVRFSELRHTAFYDLAELLSRFRSLPVNYIEEISSPNGIVTP